MNQENEEEATPPEEWELDQYNSTGTRLVKVRKVKESMERGISVVSLIIRRTGIAADRHGVGTLINHLSVDEAEALATLLMYQAQQIRQEQEDAK